MRNKNPYAEKPKSTEVKGQEEKVAENLALHYMFARVRARVIENGKGE